MLQQQYDECRCINCPLHYQCFTQERVFSDMQMQGLFEALIASGHTREEALVKMIEHLRKEIRESNQPTKTPAYQPINPWDVSFPKKYITWQDNNTGGVPTKFCAIGGKTFEMTMDGQYVLGEWSNN